MYGTCAIIEFCNLKFKGFNKENVFYRESNNLNFVIPCNAELIVKAQKNKRFANIINNNIATLDGQIPYILFKLKNRSIEVEKLSGSDLIYDFCELAKNNNKRVFLLGGYPESNSLSVKKLKEKYRIEIGGYSPPYEPYPFSEKNNKTILEKIVKFKPHILFVGFGAIKQEFWIDDNKNLLQSIGIEYAICCGGTFDFVSGRIKRAPKFIQKIGLEGVWRLILEPKWFRVKRLIESSKIFGCFIKYEVLR